MGYDVHITRKKFWFDEINEEIALEEWIELVIEDSEMRLDKFAETSLSNGQILRVESEGLAVWTSYSKHAENESMAWFNYFNGRIAVKNPDSEILGKMWSLAQKLAAKVQGDEGEIYDAYGNVTE